MLMSLDTSTTWRGACSLRSAWPPPRIWLSALPGGRLVGRLYSSGAVWKNRCPPAARWPVESSPTPCAMSAPCAAAASASSVRLAWRPLRATSVMPFLWLSSSSSTIIGRKMSCSSKRNRQVGSCSSTLVSSTNSLAGPCGRLRWWRPRTRAAATRPGGAGAGGAGGGGGGGLWCRRGRGCVGPGCGLRVFRMQRCQARLRASWRAVALLRGRAPVCAPAHALRLRRPARALGRGGLVVGVAGAALPSRAGMCWAWGARRAGRRLGAGGRGMVAGTRSVVFRKPKAAWRPRRLLARGAKHCGHRNDPKSMRQRRRSTRRSSGLFQGLDGFDRLEDFIHMARHFQTAPFLHQQAIGADQEGAALDALDLFAVHDLVLDQAEHMAHFLFGVGDEFKGQFQLFLEIVV